MTMKPVVSILVTVAMAASAAGCSADAPAEEKVFVGRPLRARTFRYVESMAFSPDGTKLAVLGHDEIEKSILDWRRNVNWGVQIFEFPDLNISLRIPPQKPSFGRVRFLDDDHLLWYKEGAQEMSVYDLDLMAEKTVVKMKEDSYIIDWGRDSTKDGSFWYLVGDVTDKRKVLSWWPAGVEEALTLSGGGKYCPPDYRVAIAQFTEDMDMMVLSMTPFYRSLSPSSFGETDIVRAFDVNKGTLLYEVDGLVRMRGPVISPNGKTLFIAQGSRNPEEHTYRVIVHDVGSKEVVGEIGVASEHFGKVTGSSRYFIYYTMEGALQVYDIEAGRQRFQIKPSAGREITSFRQVAVNSDETVIAVSESTEDRCSLAGSDPGPERVISLWGIPSGKKLSTIGGLHSNAWRLRFSPDGRYLVAPLAPSGAILAWPLRK